MEIVEILAGYGLAVEAIADIEGNIDLNIKGIESSKSGFAANRHRPSFRTLNLALARTGLAGTVSSSQFTVFAPSEAAFASLGLYANNIASVPNLREIFLYHVLGGKVYSADLKSGFIPTLNGAGIEVKLDYGLMINGAQVVQADINARNGVIHAIDKVIFPPTKFLVDIALSSHPISLFWLKRW